MKKARSKYQKMATGGAGACLITIALDVATGLLNLGIFTAILRILTLAIAFLVPALILFKGKDIKPMFFGAVVSTIVMSVVNSVLEEMFWGDTPAQVVSYLIYVPGYTFSLREVGYELLIRFAVVSYAHAGLLFCLSGWYDGTFAKSVKIVAAVIAVLSVVLLGSGVARSGPTTTEPTASECTTCSGKGLVIMGNIPAECSTCSGRGLQFSNHTNTNTSPEVAQGVCLLIISGAMFGLGVYADKNLKKPQE